MTDPFRYIPSHRRMAFLIRALNIALVIALLAFSIRGYPGPGPEGPESIVIPR